LKGQAAVKINVKGSKEAVNVFQGFIEEEEND
jgi:hypothetical protein